MPRLTVPITSLKKSKDFDQPSEQSLVTVLFLEPLKILIGDLSNH